ncbi:MAG TPA: hypothetical protein VHA56_04240 [Mucilaginibacter sp.]|nr:hypothetical protein [Mucilaginibacter sp.]
MDQHFNNAKKILANRIFFKTILIQYGNKLDAIIRAGGALDDAKITEVTRELLALWHQSEGVRVDFEQQLETILRFKGLVGASIRSRKILADYYLYELIQQVSQLALRSRLSISTLTLFEIAERAEKPSCSEYVHKTFDFFSSAVLPSEDKEYSLKFFEDQEKICSCEWTILDYLFNLPARKWNLVFDTDLASQQDLINLMAVTPTMNAVEGVENYKTEKLRQGLFDKMEVFRPYFVKSPELISSYGFFNELPAITCFGDDLRGGLQVSKEYFRSRLKYLLSCFMCKQGHRLIYAIHENISNLSEPGAAVPSTLAKPQLVLNKDGSVIETNSLRCVLLEIELLLFLCGFKTVTKG